MATGYGAGVGRVPLLTDPARAARQINASIGTATHGHITKVISAQAAQSATPPPIVFSRPYLLLVSATGTGEPLFLARVANPDMA